MGSDCTMAAPGECSTCGRKVRWAEIQSCRGTKGPAPPLWETGCADCRFASEPLRAADGSIIGTKGCGCGGGSQPSGKAWVHCGLANRPVMEAIGIRCVRKEPAIDSPHNGE